MDSKQRRNISWSGSALFHILIVLVIAFTGILHSQQLKEDIVEIAFVGGGGGGGSGDGSDISENALADEISGEEVTSLQEEIPVKDAITENTTTAKQSPMQKNITKKQIAAGKSSSGRGTGIGSGNGSGIGPGSGSGSGGGHGSGHGTGIGSGIGPGNGIASNPAIPPRIIKSVQPVYPMAERNAKIEGTATVRFLINTDGSVEEVIVVDSSGNSNLDAAAVNACYKWKFTSARNMSGQNIRCYANMPITFKVR